MEHRHDRKQRVVFGQAEVVALKHAHGVDELRPVRVDDAFGVAGGARRVAHGRGHPLRQLRPRIAFGFCREQLLVVQHVGQPVVAFGHLRWGAVAHEDDRLDTRNLSDQGLQERKEGLVDK